MKYKISEYAKKNKVTYRTIWSWVKSSRVKHELTNTGRILVIDDDLQKDSVVSIYCRVSSSENKSNLDSQADRMIAYAFVLEFTD